MNKHLKIMLTIVYSVTFFGMFFLGNTFHDFIIKNKNLSIEEYIIDLDNEISIEAIELNDKHAEFMESLERLPNESRGEVKSITAKYFGLEYGIFILFSIFLSVLLLNYHETVVSAWRKNV